MNIDDMDGLIVENMDYSAEAFSWKKVSFICVFQIEL